MHMYTPKAGDTVQPTSLVDLSKLLFLFSVIVSLWGVSTNFQKPLWHKWNIWPRIINIVHISGSYFFHNVRMLATWIKLTKLSEWNDYIFSIPLSL